MPEPALTTRQAAVLRCIHRYRHRHGISPRLIDIAEELDVGKVTIADHLDSLEQAGAITRERFKSRSVRLTRAGYLCLPAAARRKKDPPVGDVLREAWASASDRARMSFYIEEVEPWLSTCET